MGNIEKPWLYGPKCVKTNLGLEMFFFIGEDWKYLEDQVRCGQGRRRGGEALFRVGPRGIKRLGKIWSRLVQPKRSSTYWLSSYGRWYFSGPSGLKQDLMLDMEDLGLIRRGFAYAVEMVGVEEEN